MINWYGLVSSSLAKLPECIDYYLNQLEEARVEAGLVGNIERNASQVPGIVEHRFNQLQEIEAILEEWDHDYDILSDLLNKQLPTQRRV